MMHQFKVKRNQQRQILTVFIRKVVLAADSESAPGGPLQIGKTGLVSTDIAKAYYVKEGAAAAVLISAVAGTLGTWVSGGFVEVDATNMPGVYQFCPPNVVFAQGAKWVDILLHFADATEAESAQIHVETSRGGNA